MAQARVYNRGAQVREFKAGDKVMVLISTHECKCLATWHGPLSQEVVKRTGPVNYTPEVPMGKQLTPHQIQELQELMDQNRDVLSEPPGWTSITANDIVTEQGRKVRLRPYRIPEARRKAIREEVWKMLKMGVIEELHSSWSRPIVLVLVARW